MDSHHSDFDGSQLVFDNVHGTPFDCPSFRFPWAFALPIAFLLMFLLLFPSVILSSAHSHPLTEADLQAQGYSISLPKEAQDVHYKSFPLPSGNAVQASFSYNGDRCVLRVLHTDHSADLSDEARSVGVRPRFGAPPPPKVPALSWFDSARDMQWYLSGSCEDSILELAHSLFSPNSEYIP